MVTFKSKDDLNKLPSTHPAFQLINKYVQTLIVEYPENAYPYNPDHHGFIALIEKGDEKGPLNDIADDWYSLDEIPWEVTSYTPDRKFIECCVVVNNDAAFILIIPNQDWIKGKILENIEHALDPEPTNF